MTDRRIWSKLLRRSTEGRKADRHQVGALPWRMGASGIEVLLITSRGTGQWIVPKGGAIPGLSPAEAAAQEAWEEAGVRGRVAKKEAGRFSHLKTRLVGAPLHCRVAVYPLKVEEEAEDFPEHGLRRKSWLSIPDAAAAVQSRELARLIKGLTEKS